METSEDIGVVAELFPHCARGLRLSSGWRCTLSRPALPGIQKYYVLSLPRSSCSAADTGELLSLAHRIGRMMATRHYQDPECYSLIYNGARTRRKPWPHVHILIAPSVSEKRKAFLFLHLKHLLRSRLGLMLQSMLGVA
jgi:hypothetical protein